MVGGIQKLEKLAARPASSYWQMTRKPNPKADGAKQHYNGRQPGRLSEPRALMRNKYILRVGGGA